MAARERPYCVTVLVLGDLGRSPRMLNHALALAEDGAKVSLAGYNETPVDNTITREPRIHLYYLRPIPRAAEGTPRFWFLLVTALRSALLGWELLWLLLVRTPHADAVLVQNPPTIPTLPVAWLAARMRGSLFFVDWHNFGYAMLAPRLGPEHFAVRLAKAWERWLGRKADAHLCVSAAMRDVLISEFGLPAPSVVLDKPRELRPLVPIAFRSAAAHQILARAGFALPEGTALAVCPTSWTADEDMDLLVEGLEHWDTQPAPSPLVRLFVLITGRGPLRESFEQRFAGAQWRRVMLRTAFLDPADYRDLLCSAHLGLCLHRSSSGVDLPMKLMDLFGARTPACVLDYGACLAEQIKPGLTAVTFRNGQELAARLDELLLGFPDDVRRLEQMQRNIEASCAETWRETWQRDAAPVFHRVFRRA